MKIRLNDDLYMYQFEPDKDRILGQNIFVLFNENECIVFDAGYERYMKKLLPILKNYMIKNVICTHFHPDHCYGLNLLPRQNLIGSKYSLETLKKFNDLDNKLLVPSILIEDKKEIKFGNHIIKIELNPGHSNCGIIIDIDGEYLLIGDEYMTTNDNEPVLPFVAESVEQHIKALNKIIDNYNGYNFLPSHGVMTSNVDDLKIRVKYLEFALKKERDLNKFYSIEDINFLSEKWHIHNIN